MNKIKEYFSTKTGEQIFSLCLLIAVVAVMLFCAIVRLCGGLWFTADLDSIDEPSVFWQEVIKGALLIFELIFTYKILCRTSWFISFCIAFVETVIGIVIGSFIETEYILTIFYFLCTMIIPVCFVRSWKTLLESIIFYAICSLYGLIFLVGRIGNISITESYSTNFIYSVLGSIDYKLFFVCLYLIIKYFGGFKLWKKQKRLIFQTDLTTKNETE